MRRRKHYHARNTLPLSSIQLLKLVFICLLLSTITLANEALSNLKSSSSSIDQDGQSNFLRGQQLFHQGHYTTASSYLWRSVLLHSSSSSSYTINEAFSSFLKCYIQLNRLVDGYTFVAAESFMRGQLDMGKIYLQQALQLLQSGNGDSNNKSVQVVERLCDIVEQYNLESLVALTLIEEVRDEVDLALSNNRNEDTDENGVVKDSVSSKSEYDISQLYNDDDSTTTQLQQLLQKQYPNTTPEQLYNLGTYHFNNRKLIQAEQLFQLSCIQSNTTIAAACTNAVYLRTNLCMWGTNGTVFERDMEVVRRVMKMEVSLYRSVRQFHTNRVMTRSDDGDAVEKTRIYYDPDEMTIRKKFGIHHLNADNDYILWNRATSVHPHMMLSYPLSNDDSLLKRYSSESMASLDELRARAERRNGEDIPELPSNLPYNVEQMRNKFVKNNEVYQQTQQSESSLSFAPIKVGFVACSFSSKAVLYLSHDMFRFFDPNIVEIHIFSTGEPDSQEFIQDTMRGVDWRQRVMDTVDYFHDVREYKSDHIGLARYIHDLEIQILIEWDGYARQGLRAAGLMALRPAPIQILHQEFLMTSGAQYIDYIVTDKIVSPQHLEGLYTEKFLWLPHHFFSKGHAMQKELYPPQLDYVPKETKESEFQLGVGSPQENACLSPNPLGKNGDEEVSFVYCNFNKFLKHNPETMRSWIRILEEVPNSILCLLENPVDAIPNVRKFVTEASSTSSSNGKMVDLNDRIHFLPWMKNPFDHQRRSFSLCNAMLDSNPYNGHTTAQDALYAGVPIVTRSDGDDMASRVSTSANVALGLEELNAHKGIEEYETIAIRLGTDKDWFASIRTKLILTCLQKSPMHPYWDVPRYVRNFQNGLREIWANFLRGGPLDHVDVKEEDLRGTMATEIVAIEERRKNARAQRLHNAELTNAERSEL